jgi:MYXO-CTERM domain-containing protein
MLPALAALILALSGSASAREDGTCSAWRAAVELGNIASAELTEVSGLAASHIDPGVLWLHDDHGGGAFLHAAGLQGQDYGQFELVGVENIDWEDLAPGPCPSVGEPCTCLHLADMGDNDSSRGGGVVYRIAEPGVGRAATLSSLAPLDEIHFSYPDGAHDAEALLVHPETGEVLVLTKADVTGVYAFPTVPPQPATASNPVQLTLIAELDITDSGADKAQVTGGAVSPRGYRVVLRTDEDLVLFTGTIGSPLEAILQGQPVALPTPPPGAGESVGFGLDGQRLYLVGEDVLHPAIHAVDCASFVSDGEDDWDPLVECEGSCGCTTTPRGGTLFPLLLGLVGLARRRRQSQPLRP